VVLQAGQSSITLDGGDITFACPRNFTAKGGMHVLDKGGSGKAALAKLPTQLVTIPNAENAADSIPKYDEQIVYKDQHGPIAEMPYKVVNKANAGQELIDASPLDGTLERLGTPAAETLEYALRYATFKFE
jgi:type VI secretion system secreted protein VgrG